MVETCKELVVLRSDGVLSTKDRGRDVVNAPTGGMLDSTPDADEVVDYWKYLPPDNTRHVGWLRKIGGMIARELKLPSGMFQFLLDAGPMHLLTDCPDITDHEYTLQALPKDYQLFEHLEYSLKGKGYLTKWNDKLKQNEPKLERKDVYLYGHPYGSKHRFRSPQEFFHHAFWLATDQVGNRDNCCCKACSPNGDIAAGKGRKADEEVEEESEATPKKKAQKKKSQVAPLAAPLMTKRAAPETLDIDESKRIKIASEVSHQKVPVPSKVTTAQQAIKIETGRPLKTEPSQGVSDQPQRSNDSQPEPLIKPELQQASFFQLRQPMASHSPQPGTPQPGTQSPNAQLNALRLEHALDTQKDVFMYRPGELVWAEQSESLWRLAIVQKRGILTDEQKRVLGLHYTLQVFSYMMRPLSPMTLQQGGSNMRPWLACMPPGVELQELADPTRKLQELPWQMLEARGVDPETLSVEASKIAARQTDESYTLFAPAGVEQGGAKAWYNGIFLGAEKIWTGDAIRIQIPYFENAEVKPIMVVKKILEEAITPEITGVCFIGDVWQFVSMQLDNTKPYVEQLGDQSGLPIQVRSDLSFRNKTNLQGYPPSINTWRVVAQDYNISISAVYGRWYKNQQVPGPLLNRGHLSLAGTSLPGVKMMDRLDAFRYAVPQNFVIRGTDTV
jgi:Transcription-silencing protein, cryptic loci regulator Clr2/Transcription-silencing protein Clr2